MSKPITGLFPYGGSSKSSYLSCLIFFFFFSVAKIFRGLPLSYLIHITLEGVQSLFSFPVNTNTESISQNSISLVD